MKKEWYINKKFLLQNSVKLWQIPQNLLNDHFTNVIIQKVLKTKFVNNYRAYVRIKNKMIKYNIITYIH